MKTESSDKERRDIKIGASDDNYTEVVSGLSEGELVYYDSDSAIPSDYTTYDIKLNNFKKTGTSRSYKMVDTNQVTYSSPAEGYFTKFDLAEGQEVKKGDLLFTVDSMRNRFQISENRSTNINQVRKSSRQQPRVMQMVKIPFIWLNSCHVR